MIKLWGEVKLFRSEQNVSLLTWQMKKRAFEGALKVSDTEGPIK